MQQTCGQLQLPLNNVGIMALDYAGYEGVATSIGTCTNTGPKQCDGGFQTYQLPKRSPTWFGRHYATDSMEFL